MGYADLQSAWMVWNPNVSGETIETLYQNMTLMCDVTG
jgi:hypothetical protein